MWSCVACPILLSDDLICVTSLLVSLHAKTPDPFSYTSELLTPVPLILLFQCFTASHTLRLVFKGYLQVVIDVLDPEQSKLMALFVSLQTEIAMYPRSLPLAKITMWFFSLSSLLVPLNRAELTRVDYY